ncbi:hypothetical protein EV360DRAFT_90204 [Lentinula raphanica]|nr:hypothetical protein EV360DRAFT_90204 [Lentinula raphanica]
MSLANSVSFLGLPEELLHLITIYASLRPNPVNHYHEVIPEILQFFLPTTKAIQSLSLVCRKLRQLSLPVLLACVWVDRSKGPLRLEEDCMANAHFARSIRALVVLEVLDKEWNHLEKLPSHLPYLKYVHLRGKIAKDSYFLFALGRHQNVRTIVVPSFRHLPDTSWTLAEHYLSKVLLRRFDLAKPKDIAQSVSHNQRIQVATISVRKVLHLLQEDSLSFSSKKFMGVRELSIDMGCSSDGFPWLPHFVSAHCPGLHKIVFLDLGLGAHVRQTDRPTIPFAIPFWESVSQAQQEGLDRRAYTLKSMSVSPRFNQVTRSEQFEYPDQWDVCEVDLVINSSLDQILAIVASSFQTLIVFDLRLRGEIKYNIDDFIASLRSLPLLQHLGLFDSYSHLVCQDEKTCTGHHSTRDVDWVVDGSRPEDAVGMNVVPSSSNFKEQSELVAELDRGVGPRRSQWTARVWLEGTNLGHTSIQPRLRRMDTNKPSPSEKSVGPRFRPILYLVLGFGFGPMGV